MGGEGFEFNVAHKVSVAEGGDAAGLGVDLGKSGLGLAHARLLDAEAGLGLADLLAGGVILQAQEGSSGGDGVAVVDEDFGDATADLGVERNLIFREDGAAEALDQREGSGAGGYGLNGRRGDGGAGTFGGSAGNQAEEGERKKRTGGKVQALKKGNGQGRRDGRHGRRLRAATASAIRENQKNGADHGRGRSSTRRCWGGGGRWGEGVGKSARQANNPERATAGTMAAGDVRVLGCLMGGRLRRPRYIRCRSTGW